jgi:hypothetical protein
MPSRQRGTLDPAALLQYRSRLNPGAVLRLYSGVAEKTKRHVLIFANSDRALAFLINSTPSALVRSKPDWLKRQVLMPQETHRFMDHDSHIACHDTVALPKFATLAEGLANGHVEHLGDVDRALHPRIVAATAGSNLIAARDINLIVVRFGKG